MKKEKQNEVSRKRFVGQSGGSDSSFLEYDSLASVVLLRTPALGEESRAPSFQAIRQNSVLTENSYHVSGL